MVQKLIKVIEYPDGRREEFYKDEEEQFDFSGLADMARQSIPGSQTFILIMVPEKYKDEKFKVFDNGKWRHIVCEKDSQMMKDMNFDV